jgi:hypothetical protein
VLIEEVAAAAEAKRRGNEMLLNFIADSFVEFYERD